MWNAERSDRTHASDQECALSSLFGFTDWDVDDRPQVVIWEATRACALACRHCRASARPRPGPDELTAVEGEKLVAQVAAAKPQTFVMTGGDPLERPDLWHLMRLARTLGLRPALAPSATPRLTQEAVRQAAAAGCTGIQLSIDGADAKEHDGMRGHPGTFARTLEACGWVREAGLALTVATTVTRHNVERMAEMCALVERLGVARWSVFFLVPTGRARAQDMVPPAVAEAVLIWLHSIAPSVPFAIKTTEAPQIRRLALASGRPAPGRHGIGDGRGFAFVSATGDICPSGFLPLPAGNVRSDDLLATYRHHPLFRSLRDPDALRGERCGVCPHRAWCGGSRSRAYAVSGDPLGDDPLCLYEPQPAARGESAC